MSLKKKVRVVCRSDDPKALKSFDNNFPAAQWFSIPKGYEIRIIGNQVYFDNVAEELEVVSNKTTVIGFTPEISIVGLVPDADFEALKELLSPKEIVKVKQMEMKF